MKKNFYKKFLYEPFPVESNLLCVLPDHLNAEIVAGTIGTTQNAIDYLTWTYFFRRLLQNPAFYNISSLTPDDINNYLTNLISAAVKTLEKSQCLVIENVNEKLLQKLLIESSMLTILVSIYFFFFSQDGRTLYPTSIGRIASYYYIKHETMLHLTQTIKPDSTIEELLDILSHVTEYDDVPVRHNEEHLNALVKKKNFFMYFFAQKFRYTN